MRSFGCVGGHANNVNLLEFFFGVMIDGIYNYFQNWVKFSLKDVIHCQHKCVEFLCATEENVLPA